MGAREVVLDYCVKAQIFTSYLQDLTEATEKKRMNTDDYFLQMIQSKFTLSPPGIIIMTS